MSRPEALKILDLTEGATEQEISAAHTRLIKQFHPDKGGSAFFAKQLNQARDVLLGHR
jgi:DnaJ-class molecular chaperone